MITIKLVAMISLLGFLSTSIVSAQVTPKTQSKGRVVAIPAHVLADKIRGGLLGQILGNLNGLPHENQYIDRPGDVGEYVPALPDGARTDDDTDFEWVYIVAMQQEGHVLIPYPRIAELWRSRINEGIWCSNLYARRLMDLGIEPPLTGSTLLNPWAEFNISGQFLCETFGLIAPGMPQTASKLGLHYTRVAIDDEPAQSTQLFCTMIALAFVEDDIDTLLEEGLTAIDADSRQRTVVNDVRTWYRQYPRDWRTTRRLLKEKYSQAGGGMRDRNGYELTTGATVAALLYGAGDLPETLRLAFNFGWDADNSAATAGAIVGVLSGYRSMLSQGWAIVDRYRNTTRDGMPMDETITSFADRLTELAEQIILQGGGERVVEGGRPTFRILAEAANNLHPLRGGEGQQTRLPADVEQQMRQGFVAGADDQHKARGAYLAICFGLASSMAEEYPDRWPQAIAALNQYQPLIEYLYSDQPATPSHHRIQGLAKDAGLVVLAD